MPPPARRACRYGGQIVEFAVDAHLRKLGNAWEEYELQIGVAVLQWTVEIAHHLTENGQLLVLMYHVQQGSVILVDEHHYLLARLDVDVLYQILETYICVYLVGLQPKASFVFRNNVE